MIDDEWKGIKALFDVRAFDVMEKQRMDEGSKKPLKCRVIHPLYTSLLHGSQLPTLLNPSYWTLQPTISKSHSRHYVGKGKELFDKPTNCLGSKIIIIVSSLLLFLFGKVSGKL